MRVVQYEHGDPIHHQPAARRTERRLAPRGRVRLGYGLCTACMRVVRSNIEGVRISSSGPRQFAYGTASPFFSGTASASATAIVDRVGSDLRHRHDPLPAVGRVRDRGTSSCARAHVSNPVDSMTRMRYLWHAGKTVSGPTERAILASPRARHTVHRARTNACSASPFVTTYYARCTRDPRPRVCAHSIHTHNARGRRVSAPARVHMNRSEEGACARKGQGQGHVVGRRGFTHPLPATAPARR